MRNFAKSSVSVTINWAKNSENFAFLRNRLKQNFTTKAFFSSKRNAKKCEIFGENIFFPGNPRHNKLTTLNVNCPLPRPIPVNALVNKLQIISSTATGPNLHHLEDYDVQLQMMWDNPEPVLSSIVYEQWSCCWRTLGDNSTR